jgi:hypothetical protein
MELELMDRDVVVIPTVSDQVPGIGVAAPTPGHHVVDLKFPGVDTV